MPVAETFTFRDELDRSLSDVARLDTMVTVVDGMNFLRDYQEAASLASRGETLGEEDQRFDHRPADRPGRIRRCDPGQQDRPDLQRAARGTAGDPAPAQCRGGDPADGDGSGAAGEDPRYRSLRFRSRGVRAGLAEGTARRAPAGNRGIWHRLHGLPGAPSVPPRALPRLPAQSAEAGAAAALKGFFWLASRPARLAAGRRPAA